MKINFDNFPALSLLKSLFTDTNKARVAHQMDEVRRFFLYQASHWYVLVSLALMSVPLIFMSAGKDIAYGLFDNQKDAYWSSLVFILELCWVLLLYALICWRLPLHYVAEKYLSDQVDDINTPHTEGVNFREPMRLKTYRFNGFLAFALIISWLLSYSKVKMEFWDIAGVSAYVIALWLASDYFAHALNRKRLKWQKITLTDRTSFYQRVRHQKPLVAVLVPSIGVFVVLLAVAVALTYKEDNANNYLILAGSLGFMAVIFYVFADYIDRVALEKRPILHLSQSLRSDAGFIERSIKKIQKMLTPFFTWFVYLFVTHDTHDNLADNSWKKPFLYIHVFCFIHVLLATLFFYLVPNMQAIHPVFCILYGVSFVVYILDWMNYIFYRKYYVFALWTLLGFALLLISMIAAAIWAKSNDFDINYISTSVNVILLLIVIKWLRFPNIDNYTILDNGDVIDRTLLTSANNAQLPTNKRGFSSDVASNQNVISGSSNSSANSWFGKPMHLLGSRELSIFGICVMLLLVINLALPNVATHNLALLNTGKETPKMPVLLSPKDYITGWLDSRQQELGKDSFDVYVVAGQGGGSRGAYWFAKIMTQMDSITEGGFRRQCLAMSTVSGSSVGAQGIVALWHSIPFNAQNNDAILSKFSRNAFQHNFLSGNLADLFFKDNMAAFWPCTGDFNPLTLGRGDRNHRLQREEAVRIEEALKGGDQEVDGFAYLSLLRAFRLKHLNTCTTNAPFWSFYYDYNSNKPLYEVPLLFANTCQVQGGKRSFVSAIQNDTTVFINTFDLTKRLMQYKIINKFDKCR